MRPIHRALALFVGLQLFLGQPALADEPIALKPGPQLFLDDYLIAKSEGVTREVTRAQRFLKEPVITSAPGYQNWQPWFTVHHDPTRPTASRFRIWYNADVNPDPADSAYLTKLAYLESADGVSWPGPFKQLEAEDVLWATTVLDEGPAFAKRDERFKLLYWSLTTKRYGPMVSASPDGLTWKLLNNDKPVFLRQMSWDDSWHADYDPVRKRYALWAKRHITHGWNSEEGQGYLRAVRTFGVCYSDDFVHWGPVKLVFLPDSKDPGATEFYGVTGSHRRGDLTIAFLQILRDDLRAEGAPDEAVKGNFGNPGSGMGWTTLAWSRDGGETWQRDRQKDATLSPVPEVGAWDHAMAWVSSAVPVGDELYLHYAGYRWGHKLNRSQDRQIGLVKIPKDRYVARSAGESGGEMITPVVTLAGREITLNTNAADGEVRVQVTGTDGEALAGYSFADCQPITADSLAAAVQWKRPLAELRDKPVRLEVSLRNASVYGFDLKQ